MRLRCADRPNGFALAAEYRRLFGFHSVKTLTADDTLYLVIPDELWNIAFTRTLAAGHGLTRESRPDEPAAMPN